MFSEMVERASKAYFESGYPGRNWDDLSECAKDAYRPRIRAALRAALFLQPHQRKN